jgi:hypothetical protein
VLHGRHPHEQCRRAAPPLWEDAALYL